MRATARIAYTFDGPVLEITPLPDNLPDRETVARLADLMPLRFRLPYVNVATLNQDAADINAKHIQALWKG